MKNNKQYILLTAARNEEKNIENTVKSVISQSVKPLQWIIISDGSTDKTEEIIDSYADKFRFIKLYRTEGDKNHNFGSKVKAINYAKTKISIKKYSFIGIIDADISFSPDYFEILLDRFQNNPKLGICGGLIHEMFNNKIVKQKISLNSVAGAVQFFRLACFQDIGDFLPLKYGGEDAAAEITARMHSWEVQTFIDLKVMHYGYVGQASGSLFSAKYKRGVCFYQLGYHPLFQIFRCINGLKNKPLILGSIIELFAFFFSYYKKIQIILPVNTVKYLRKEQKQRLKKLFFR